MNRPAARAAVNRGLLVLLGLMVVVAAVFWIARLRRDPVGPAAAEFTLYCTTCGQVTVARSDLKWEGANFRCSKCGQFSATFNKPQEVPAGAAIP